MALADDITDALIAKARPGFDALGAELETRMKERINKPDGGTPSRPIHSKPGEDPRRESGDYRDSWSHATEINGDTLSTRAGTPKMLGLWLQMGTATMAPRPHADKLARLYGAEVVSKVAGVFSDAAKQ